MRTYTRVQRQALTLLLALLLGVQTLAPANSQAGAQQSFHCSYHPLVQAMMEESSHEDWMDWIAGLSGAKPVVIGAQEYTIETRSSLRMFLKTDNDNALAYPYVLQTLRQWYPTEQIYEHTYSYYGQTWKNLVLDLPGEVYPEQVVVLTAHLDSTSLPWETAAPGADDNAAGAAALLEAARLFRFRFFERTVRLIWFTGEEQGMIGSQAYVRDHAVEGVLGVINLDMFSYDSDGDRCFELHVGRLPQSDAVGRCIAQAISSYSLDLKHDYFNTVDAITSSDHGSFWNAGIGAVQVGQNFLHEGTPGGCGLGADRNPNYHRVTDTIENINADFGFSITRAALAAIYSMAVPLPGPVKRFYLPAIHNRSCILNLGC